MKVVNLARITYYALARKSDWDALSKNQKNDIYKAIDELADGKHILNDAVMDKYKKLYPNE